MNFEPFEITSMSLTNIETGEEYLNIPSPQLIDFTIEEKTNYATDKHNHKLISFVEEKTFTIDIDPVGSENLLKLVGVDLLTENTYDFSYCIEKQVRRHKKKRINKKWLKRYGTYNVKIELNGCKVNFKDNGEVEFAKLI